MPLINFSGIASGIDSNALIDATSSASRAQRVEPKEDKITELEDANSALSELKTMLLELQSILRNSFSTLAGGGVVKTGKSSDETVLTAVAANSANNGTYSLSVSQLAKNATYGFKSTGRTYTSSDGVIAPGMAGSGPVQVTTGTGTDQEIVNVTVDNTTTLNTYVTNYNNTATKSVASVVNVGTTASPDYRVIIVTNNPGTEKGQISVSVDAAITADNAFNNNSTSQATNATFTVSGIGAGAGDTITRSSNTFSDVIPGVTITLEATGSATLTVGDDAASTVSKVQEFVDKYNEIVAFLKEQNLVTREEDGENVQNLFGPLANTRTDDGVLTSLRANLSSASYSSGTKVKIFADLGITTERDGTLKFDTNVLTTAIGDEAASVRRVLQNFGDAAGITGGSIDQYVRFNGLIDVTVNGNRDLISNLNDQIARAEASILKEEEIMRSRFARLESLIGRLQNQQASLTSALSGLGGNRR